MRGARVFSFTLLSLVVGVSTAAYAQGEHGKKSDPAASKPEQQHQPAKSPPGQARQAPPPAHAQPVAQPQRTQAPSSARQRAPARQAAQPVAQRQRVQAAAPTRARTPTPAQARTASRPTVPVRTSAPAPVQMRPASRPTVPVRTALRPTVLPADVQRQRTQMEQQRATQYRQRLDQQVRFSQQQAAQMQQQKRINEYRAQQQYLAQLRQQQLRLQTARNYSNDPYIRTAPSYRYAYSGTTRETNQYGADVLRQAVNYGYQEGVRFGQADRQDVLPANYRNSFAYQDANYGYSGYYVDQADYNYYFRQGFQRGYADGYNSQSQYGTSLNGTSSILATLLASILGLTSLR
jgi:hypothetical protein